jgi:hypothetical protein
MERREKAEETWAKDRLSTCDEEEKEDCERGCREACYIQMQNAPLERGGGSGWCHGPGAWKLWSPCVYECECTLHLVSPYDRNEDQCLCKVRASGSVRSAFCFRSSNTADLRWIRQDLRILRSIPARPSDHRDAASSRGIGKGPVSCLCDQVDAVGHTNCSARGMASARTLRVQVCRLSFEARGGKAGQG